MTVDIDQLAALHAEARSGPWWTGPHHDTGGLSIQNSEHYIGQLVDPASAIAIAKIHNTLPELLAELRDARGTLEAAKTIADGTDGRPRPAIERIRDLRQLLSLV